MSINITVHGNPVNINNDKNFVNDTEYALKLESDRRKRIRLEQVRKQSKEIASQLRIKVHLERENQLKRVERIKSNELRNWQDREIDKKHKEYRKCLSKIGESHLAAASEANLEINQHETKLRNDALAIQRGKAAAAKLKKHTIGPKKKINKNCKSVQTQVDDKIEFLDSSTEDEGTAKHKLNDFPIKSKYFPNTPLYSEAPIQYISSDSDSKTCQENIKVKLNYDDTSSNEDAEIVEIGKTLSSPKKIYEHRDFVANSSSESTSISVVAVPNLAPFKYSSENQLLPFCEISDLIKNKQIAKEQRNERFTPDPQLLDISNLISVKSPIILKTSYNHDSKEKSSKNLHKNIPSLIDPIQIPFHINPKISSSKAIKSIIKSKPSKMIVKKPSSEMSAPLLPSSSTQQPKVQLYDNWSKFSKEYIPSNDLVVREKFIPDVPNAMEEAQKSIELERKKSLDLEETRKRENLRSEKVTEREHIRKDYDLMSSQLEALSKQEKYIRNEIQPENRFSEEKLKQSDKECEQRLNTVFENLLKKPILITCPLSNENRKTDISDVRVMNKVNVASSHYVLQDSDQIINSSDSCSSIMLGYADDRSQALSEKISGNNEIFQNSKILKLNELLEKINDQKRLILAESNRDQILCSDVINLRERKIEEKQKSMDEEKRSLDKREQLLRDRESELENRIRDMCKNEIEKHKQKQKMDNIRISKKDQGTKETHKSKNVEIETSGIYDYDDCHLSTDTSTDGPVKIIIKLNENKRKRKKSAQIKLMKNLNKNSACKFYSKTPVKPQKTPELDKIDAKTHAQQVPHKNISKNDESATTSISTVYRSPPSRISNELDILFENNIQRKNDQNPILSHFINKLLGMSRQSIDRLEVSSLSDIQTPTDSIVNVTENLIIEPNVNTEVSMTTVIDDRRVENMKKFINDNYSFSSDIESSFRKNSSTNSSATDDSGIKQIQEILKRNLELSKKKEESLKPTLKKKPKRYIQSVASKQTLKESPEQSEKVLSFETETRKNSTPDEEEHLVKRYNELTENCSQRIADLSQLITKVREEKQRIIENSLSSKSDQDCNAQNSTEYMDFANGKDDDSSRISELKSLSYNKDDSEDKQRNEAGKKLTEQRQKIGASRDSGISVSRPMTATDLHDSPDMKSQISGTYRENDLILKDVSKIRDLDKLKLEEFLAMGGNLDIYKEIIEKRNRPPISLKRYSPKLDDERPHELSTIAEVETPLTSRINISVTQRDDDLNEEKNEAISYNKFITYDKYQGIEQLNDDLLSNTDHQELEYKKFPTRVEYNNKNNLSTEIQSINLEGSGLDISKNNHIGTQNIHSYGSDSSLPDVVAELKRRNVMSRSFDNSPKKNNDESPINESIEEITISNQIPLNNPKSPKKSKPKFKLGLKTPTKTNQQSTEMVLTPKKNHPSNKNLSKKRAITKKSEEKDITQDNSLSGIGILSLNSDKTMEALEKELDQVGLKWASIMLKTTQKSMALQSTSSNNSSPNTEKKSPQKSKQNTTDSFVDPNIACSSRNIIESSFVSDESSCGGKPLNLKEFLARELMKRINPDNQSTSSDSSSIASLFLKSLLSASPSSVNASNEQEKVLAHRTSTPVTKYSSSASSKIFSLNASNGLFSGESKLSSVKLEASSRDDISSNNEIKNMNKDESLIVPNLKLNVDKYVTHSDSSST